MDPFSHALLGAASAYAISSRRTRATVLAGVGGALLPDIDVMIQSSTDPLLALEYHRHFTHALIMAPLGALLIATILWLALRRQSTLRDLYWPAFVGFLSAVLLDACTSYGTQLLWPFSNERFAASIVAVIDPVVTLILLAGVVMALRRASAGPARVAIVAMLVYLGLGALQHERAQSAAQRAAAERGHVIAKHEVKPTLGNLLLWRSVYLTGNEFVIDAVRVGLRPEPVLYAGAHVRKIEPIDLVPPLTLHSVQTRDVTRFSKVSEHHLARHPTRPRVIGDIRYAMLPDDVRPLWGIEIQPERETQHVAFHTFREFGPGERSRFVAMLRGVAADQLPPLEPDRTRALKSDSAQRP